MDPQERLEELVKDTGKVVPAYGGYEIKILKPTRFPWYNVFKLLIEVDQEIWVNEKEGRICVTSEPKVR